MLNYFLHVSGHSRAPAPLRIITASESVVYEIIESSSLRSYASVVRRFVSMIVNVISEPKIMTDKLNSIESSSRDMMMVKGLFRRVNLPLRQAAWKNRQVL
jgi:hypothetical protein